ncbi:MAG TPA: NADPH:quinone oxidoreductase family protein [Acidimicrobiia bacterium]|nr:NADPH:quinone oxidoreductase family protein [Acidimicrobiia bacterium]
MKARAVRCREYGQLSNLVVESIELPDPGAGEVLVEVHAAAVNFPDVLIVANEYQIPAPLPFTPGSELAGVVATVGEGVDDLAPGDHVFGQVFVGAFAERIVMPAASLQRIPSGIDAASAAAFGVAYTTAYHSLRTIADVQPGNWVLVLGAAGGVGLAAVEVAAALGARVIAAASSPEKLEQCRAKGATEVIDYEREDLKNRSKDISGGGVDVVIDPVGGAYTEPALRATRWGGRYVIVGFAAGDIPKIPANLILLKGPIVRGFTLQGIAQFAPRERERDLAELFELLRTGAVRPHVSKVFGLDDVEQAMAEVAERKVIGKVVIDPRR